MIVDSKKALFYFKRITMIAYNHYLESDEYVRRLALGNQDSDIIILVEDDLVRCGLHSIEFSKREGYLTADVGTIEDFWKDSHYLKELIDYVKRYIDYYIDKQVAMIVDYHIE